MGEALGRAGVSVEGGGAWVAGAGGVAHFLVAGDGAAARAALADAGVDVLDVREVVIQTLRQDVPGQLGALCRRMADAGVNIDALYSDHAQRLILLVDRLAVAVEVADAWQRDGAPRDAQG